jgi:hypothetical protein
MKRTVEERAADTSLALSLRSEGFNYREIVEQIELASGRKIAQNQIKRDLEWYLERVAYQVEGRKDRERAMQVERLAAIERAAWSGWRKSTEDELITEELEYDSTRKGVGSDRKTRRRTTIGDPRFLRTLIETIEQRTALLGLSAPPGVYTDWVGDVISALRRGALTPEMVRQIYPETAEAIIIRAGINENGAATMMLEAEIVTDAHGIEHAAVYDDVDETESQDFFESVDP